MLLSRAKGLVKRHRTVIDARRRIRPFLPAGVYSVEVAPFSRVKTSFVLPFLIKIKKPPQSVIKIDGQNGRRLVFYFSYKEIVFAGDKVFSFYRDDKWLANMSRFVGDIPYPKSEYGEISLAENYCVTRYINGRHYYDRQHKLRLAQDLLKYAVDDPDRERPERYRILNSDGFKNIRYYVQHGDYCPKNILWVNDDEYCVIDFDTIAVYPAFFDFLSLITRGKTGLFEDFVAGLFDREIKNYLSKRGIDDSIEGFKDECVAAFVTVHGAPDFEACCGVIRRYVPGTYIKTREALAIAEIRKGSCASLG